jgi:ABC-type siderophore export system fused ATPase/permease subunit
MDTMTMLVLRNESNSRAANALWHVPCSSLCGGAWLLKGLTGYLRTFTRHYRRAASLVATGTVVVCTRLARFYASVKLFLTALISMVTEYNWMFILHHNSTMAPPLDPCFKWKS